MLEGVGPCQGKLGASKDADMSPFEAGRKLLSMESSRLSLGARIDLVFQDADLVPLLVQVPPGPLDGRFGLGCSRC